MNDINSGDCATCFVPSDRRNERDDCRDCEDLRASKYAGELSKGLQPHAFAAAGSGVCVYCGKSRENGAHPPATPVIPTHCGLGAH